MPRIDQTGPMGQGPMTGRRMGRCSTEGRTQNNENQPPAEKNESGQQSNWFGKGPGFEGTMGRRGPGFGWRMGGRGRGMGQQNRFGGSRP